MNIIELKANISMDVLFILSGIPYLPTDRFPLGSRELWARDGVSKICYSSSLMYVFMMHILNQKIGDQTDHYVFL